MASTWNPMAPLHDERHLPKQSTPYRLVQQFSAIFFNETEAAAEADLQQFIKDEFEAFPFRHPDPMLVRRHAGSQPARRRSL